MIKFGLKIWSNNTQLFDEAIRRYKNSEFDFIELYSNSTVPHDYAALEVLKQIPVAAVHVGHLDKAGFHEFFFTDEQRPAWQMTQDLADFFRVSRIIVHPANTHTSETFWGNVKKLNDDRVVIESMPALSPLGGEVRKFGISLEDLQAIGKKYPMCLDVSKSIKAAVYLRQNYKQFITECLRHLRPEYFHISGCDVAHPIDQHDNLWDATFDVSWLRTTLERYADDTDIHLVFETPKEGDGLKNWSDNISF